MKEKPRTTLNSLRRREELLGWLFVTPVALGMLIFQVYPTLFSLYASFTEWNLISPPRWIGTRHFVELFTTDRFFITALVNSLVYALGTVIPGLAIALIFAVLLNQEIAGRYAYRAIYFVPVIAPTVSIAILWSWIYKPNFGILDYVLKLVGIPGPPWLSSSSWAMPAIIIMEIWHSLGYNIVIFLAGLQSISHDYYEAAAIDGAGAVQKFRYVTLPLLSPFTFFALVLAVIRRVSGVYGSVCDDTRWAGQRHADRCDVSLLSSLSLSTDGVGLGYRLYFVFDCSGSDDSQFLSATDLGIL